MSKIICDLCGTSYPDTESQCPVCGTAKTEASKIQETTADTYAYVRGGRFSKENVRKRNSGHQEPAAKPAQKPVQKPVQKPAQKPAQQPKAQPKPAPQRERQEPQEKAPSNIGLIIVVIVLLLAIISVCAYIAIRLINMDKGNGSTSSTQGTVSQPMDIPCTGVSLSQQELEFTTINKTILLQPILQPSDTTEQVYFSSSNDNVVKVDSNGLVTPVSDGEATIYVICGGFQAECKVVCNMGVEPPVPTDPPSTGPSVPPDPTEPSTPPSSQPTDPGVQLELNREDFTLVGYGASWNLANKGQGYKGPDASQVTWTSDDPTIATVVNGVVTAVGNGKTVIRAEYQGVRVACIVRCNNVTVPEPAKYELTTTDATLKVGEQFTLSLLAVEDKHKINDATFRAEDETICSVDEKGRVVGLSAGMTKIIVEHDGEQFECIIRVKEAPADEG